VVRSGLERLWKTGRGAAGLALSVVGVRLLSVLRTASPASPFALEA
jgi:hypothetical protein